MKRHADLKKELLSNTRVKVEYERLETEFEWIESLVQARAHAGLSQKEVAARMGTTQSVIARLESGATSPSLRTLRRYADATGNRLRITLTPS